MSTFAPVYKPRDYEQTYLARKQHRESQKRKRDHHSSSDDSGLQTPIQQSPDPEPTPRTGSTAFHPVNKTDPYHVAGRSREEPLPPPPFPHAAVKEPTQAKLPIEEGFAKLNPPLYVPALKSDKSTALRKRHLDNLTTILHRCMLNGDWQRASRAWGLLIRTETAGRGIDVRRNGRWGIGAELLMRRSFQPQPRREDRESVGSDDETASMEEDKGTTESPLFSDEGFKLAREYYQRLILQYPHTWRTQHSLNATSIYPALFNIWIYEVQDRSTRARRNLENSEDLSLAHDSDIREAWSRSSQLESIRKQELEQARPIAERMDELLFKPPYDAISSLLQLRGMVALWMSDLHAALAGLAEQIAKDVEAYHDSYADSIDVDELLRSSEQHRRQADDDRQTARRFFGKLIAMGAEVPGEVVESMEPDSD